MSEEGVDYAFSQPSAIGLAAAGKRFAMRYVGPGSAGKHLTIAERDRLWAAGLSVALLVEGAAGDILAGYATGRAHAQSAESARLALGAPALPLYFAADKDMTSANLPAINAYLQGAASVIGAARVGIYGEYDVMRWTHDAGTAAWFFQTYAWSGQKWFPLNHIEQYRNNQSLANGTVDLCRALVANFGQWTRSDTAAAIKKDDMDFNQNAKLDAVFNVYPTVKLDTDAIPDGKGGIQEFPVPLTATLARIEEKVSAPAPVAVDAVTLADAFKLALQDPATLAAVAKAVNDDLHARLEK